MFVVKKKTDRRLKPKVKTAFLVCRVTPEEKRRIVDIAGGNTSLMMRVLLGLENNIGAEGYVNNNLGISPIEKEQ